jgi:hypothetical protein
MMPINEKRSDLPDTISTLRVCNALQSEVIQNMENYQAAMTPVGQERDARSGRRFGYFAELSYLHDRRAALDALIAAVERYEAATAGAALRKLGR